MDELKLKIDPLIKYRLLGDEYEWMRKSLPCWSYSLRVHDQFAKKPSKAFRKWDDKTPYGIHPTWCAMTILAETSLPEDVRILGCRVLLLHDVPEDTTAGMPSDTTPLVAELVESMTFTNSAEEMKEVWTKGPLVLLFKLYDKTSNLLDGVWMPEENRERYAQYLLRLCGEVEKIYGSLNITKIARAIVA